MPMNNIINPHYAHAWVGLLDPLLNCPVYEIIDVGSIYHTHGYKLTSVANNISSQ